MSVPVCYVGSFLDSSGYGSANRAEIASLYISGVDLTAELAVHMKERAELGWEEHLSYSLIRRSIPYKIKIIHLTPDMYEPYMERGKYHIGRLIWETDRLPQGWTDCCNKMNEIWATSPHMANLFRESGVKVPIFTFPQPIDISLADKQYKKFYVPSHHGLLFYSIFQWIERKNPQLLLQSYWQTFKGYDDVSLLIKSFRLNYDGSEFNRIRDDILKWKRQMGAGAWPRIFLSIDHLSQDEMMRIHTTGDVMISPHRGEGWGRTIAEALLMGKPVIATALGGIHEYLGNEHYFGLDRTMIPVTEVPEIKFYTKDQKWGEPDKDHFTKTLKFVYDNYKLSTSKGLMAQGFVKEKFNYQVVGEMMKKRLEDIHRAL